MNLYTQCKRIQPGNPRSLSDSPRSNRVVFHSTVPIGTLQPTETSQSVNLIREIRTHWKAATRSLRSRHHNQCISLTYVKR
jgi:hypothetical protein